MIYTDDEMVFMNSILGNEKIFALEITYPFIMNEEYVKETTKSLQTKKIIKEDGKLNAIHPNPIILLEFYKKADFYIICNNQYMGLSENGDMICISKGEEGYHIWSGETWLYVHELIANSDILNQNMKKYKSGTPGFTNKDSYVEDVKAGAFNNASIFRKYKQGELKEELSFFWNEEEFIYYSSAKEERKEIDGKEGRKIILNLFELKDLIKE